MQATKFASPVCKAHAFSHGTLEVANLDRTGEFYTEFLGIGWHRQARVAGGFSSGSTGWYVACLGMPTGITVDQTRDYRWVLALGSPEAVHDAHAKALANQERYSIQVIEDVVPSDIGGESFVIRDANGCWWEFEHRPANCYDDIFAAGEHA
ncbi:VOC family protein [Sphingobium chungangianum]